MAGNNADTAGVPYHSQRCHDAGHNWAVRRLGVPCAARTAQRQMQSCMACLSGIAVAQRACAGSGSRVRARRRSTPMQSMHAVEPESLSHNGQCAGSGSGVRPRRRNANAVMHACLSGIAVRKMGRCTPGACGSHLVRGFLHGMERTLESACSCHWGVAVLVPPRNSRQQTWRSLRPPWRELASESSHVFGAPGETFGPSTCLPPPAGRAMPWSHWLIARPAHGSLVILTFVLSLLSAGAIYLACEYFVNGVEWVGAQVQSRDDYDTVTLLAAFRQLALPESAGHFRCRGLRT